MFVGDDNTNVSSLMLNVLVLTIFNLDKKKHFEKGREREEDGRSFS
jgi:hypothetical protein